MRQASIPSEIRKMLEITQGVFQVSSDKLTAARVARLPFMTTKRLVSNHQLEFHMHQTTHPLSRQLISSPKAGQAKSPISQRPCIPSQPPDHPIVPAASLIYIVQMSGLPMF
jgi:hypothetical protein